MPFGQVPFRTSQLGEGKEEVRGARREAGGRFFIEKKKEGGGVPGRVRAGGGARGWEDACGELGGGANFFFRGRNSHRGGEF